MDMLLAVAYLWTQVIIPGKNPVSLLGINDKSQVAVTTDDGTTGIYDHGKFTPLPPPPTSCGCSVAAGAVNDAGVVVGASTPIAGGSEQGFILTGSTYTFFSWAGWDNTEPRGIGDQGLVVGYAFANDFSASAGFVYDPSTGTFTNVTPGSGFPSIGQGINRSRVIAGSFVQPAPFKRFGLISQWQFSPPPPQIPFTTRFQVLVN